ncbi:MAG: SDR family oxidoreductase [Bacteroidia bacterium]|nr:SDR family oxidoreductase [Bacteroidia bacterium]MCZ2277057.1 SDR family oxidoreductase [Bacteroidia bacterium]
MKILITGSNGLLGQKIVYALKAKSGIEVMATARGQNRIRNQKGYQFKEMDIENCEQVFSVFDQFKPEVAIHTAAMTNVDACELNPEQCRKSNIEATRNLTEAAKKNNCHFIFLSTDFVFDGFEGPYDENAIPNPLSIYAGSKLEGEKIVRNSGLTWCIIRTIIIYGVTDDLQRSNIVLWVKNSLEQKKEIRVITDQYRSPTLAEDLAGACIKAALQKTTGIYHVSGNEILSIIQIAYKVADFFNLDKAYIIPVTTAELNQPARRPLKTGFFIHKAMRDLDYHPHSLDEGLALVARQLSERKTDS